MAAVTLLLTALAGAGLVAGDSSTITPIDGDAPTTMVADIMGVLRALPLPALCASW